MEWIYALAGLLTGGLLVFLMLNQKSNSLKLKLQFTESQLEKSKGELENKAQELEGKVKDFEEVKEQLFQAEERFREKEKSFEERIAELDQRILQKEENIDLLSKEKNKIEKEAIKMSANLEAEIKTLTIRLEESRKLLKEQEEKFAKIEENFKTEFKNMAQEILEEKSKKFTEAGKKDLQEVLRPLKDKLQDFSKQVRETYENETRERFSLKEEIKRLNEMNVQLSEQATNLATALKGESKTQGDWGEMILENILSESGLTLGREYFKQESVRNEEGNLLRPDFVVKYPDERFIIIDSKVSLRSYEKYVAAENAEEKKRYLEGHIKAVNERIKELSSKNYQDNFEGSPDFVMMFMPVEPAYLLAIQNDAGIWNRAYEKRVLLMSPTNLIAALKMISELWKHDAQNKNTIEIADAAASLYDKFVAFYADLDHISKSLEKVSTNFEAAKNKLHTGRGNLVSRVEKLKSLGIKTKKSLGMTSAAPFLNENTSEDE